MHSVEQTGEICLMMVRGRTIFACVYDAKGVFQAASPLVKSIYQTPDNPAFEIFSLDGAAATIADFSGNPPQTLRL